MTDTLTAPTTGLDDAPRLVLVTCVDDEVVHIDALGAVVRRHPDEDGAWVTPVEPGLTLDGAPLDRETFVTSLRPDGAYRLRKGDAVGIVCTHGEDCEVRVYAAS